MSEPEQPPAPQRPTLKPDEPKPEMTQEELQRQLLETQKRLVELQEQQNLRHEEEQAENKRKEEKHHDNNVKAAIIVILVIIALVVGVIAYRDYKKTEDANNRAGYGICRSLGGDSDFCASTNNLD